jgi:hypothetical protein
MPAAGGKVEVGVWCGSCRPGDRGGGFRRQRRLDPVEPVQCVPIQDLNPPSAEPDHPGLLERLRIRLTTSRLVPSSSASI